MGSAVNTQLLRMDHSLVKNTFHMQLHHSRGTDHHSLKEYSIFGEGFRSYHADGSYTILPQTFGTFRSEKAWVHLKDDGKLLGWVDMSGALVQLDKHMQSADMNVSLVDESFLRGKDSKKDKDDQSYFDDGEDDDEDGVRNVTLQVKREDLKVCFEKKDCREYHVNTCDEHLECEKDSPINCHCMAEEFNCDGLSGSK